MRGPPHRWDGYCFSFYVAAPGQQNGIDGRMHCIVDKAKDLAGDAKDVAGHVADKAQDVAGDVADKAKDVASEIKDRADYVVHGDDEDDKPAAASTTSPASGGTGV